MKIQDIKNLLEKYYEGDSSLSEEESLKTFFSKEDIPLELKPDQDLFLYYSVERTAENAGSSHDTKLRENILNAISSPGRKLTFSTGYKGQLYWLSGIAASLILILASYFLLINHGPKDSFEDPQLAYLEAKKVLEYVSVKFNEGTQPVKEGISKMDRSMEHLNKISGINRGLNELSKASTFPSGMNALGYFDMLQNPGAIISNYTKK
ncbi:MAG: hypothetical protein U9N53_10760 [Bacteroidota bacterium]|nr:hypothetical protein [Bacteroidota bacterium]